MASENEAFGYFVARVSEGRGAYPVEGTTVRLSSFDGSGAIRTLRTDSSGITEKVELLTRPADLSETPGEKKPYLTYNADVRKDGYYPTVISNIPIFEGITSTLPVDMIPLPYGESPYDDGFDATRRFEVIPDSPLGGNDE